MPRAGLSVDRVVGAAADLADEVGLEQVTLSSLARRFGVRPASLYSHVRGSDDLRTRVALLALDDLATRAADAVAGRSGGDAIRALGEVHRTYAAAHPAATTPPGCGWTPRPPPPARVRGSPGSCARCCAATGSGSPTRPTPYDWSAASSTAS